MYKRRLVTFLPVILVVVTFSFLFALLTKSTDAATLTSASATMSNSRMSYKALISSGAAGSSLITITAGSSDTNTNHLFPGDAVCFTDAGNNVCRDNKTYTVANIVDTTHFNLTTPLTTALTGTDYAVASQSATWSIAFTTVNQVPIGGSILVTIPVPDADSTSRNNNGIPDSSSSVTTSGFNMNGLVAGNVVATGCGSSWSSPTVTVGGGGTTDTTISIPRATGICAVSSPITITVGGNGVVNPSAVTSGHSQGTADVYGITVATRDSGTNTIDTATPRLAPVEAVLISATVDESLSFVVTGLGTGTSHCGTNTTVTTTPTSVPWGHFAATDTFYYAAQNLAVSTNGATGYAVTIQENDQMGKGGNVCTGTSPSSGNYTFSAGTCIRDTVCSAATPCSESVMGDWPTASGYPGLGYSLATTSGTTAAVFWYNQGGRAFNSKQLADKTEGSESPATIMSSSIPVSGDAIDVCYKISVPGTQPSGYYYNIAKYTATATF